MIPCRTFTASRHVMGYRSRFRGTAQRPPAGRPGGGPGLRVRRGQPQPGAATVARITPEPELNADRRCVTKRRHLTRIADVMPQVATATTNRLLALVRRLGVVRPRDLAGRGVPRTTLAKLVAEGVLDRPSRGVYVLADADVTEHHDLAEACKRVPHGVVCLLSALRFHRLTTQAPLEVWLGDRPQGPAAEARPPAPPHRPLLRAGADGRGRGAHGRGRAGAGHEPGPDGGRLLRVPQQGRAGRRPRSPARLPAAAAGDDGRAAPRRPRPGGWPTSCGRTWSRWREQGQPAEHGRVRPAPADRPGPQAGRGLPARPHPVRHRAAPVPADPVRARRRVRAQGGDAVPALGRPAAPPDPRPRPARAGATRPSSGSPTVFRDVAGWPSRTTG